MYLNYDAVHKFKTRLPIMSLYPLYGRFGFYEGPFGDAKKDDVYKWDSDRLTTAIDQEEENWSNPANDKAGDRISHLNYTWRFNREMTLDALNPREELPKDVVSEQLIGVPDLLDQPMIDLSMPEDYQA